MQSWPAFGQRVQIGLSNGLAWPSLASLPLHLRRSSPAKNSNKTLIWTLTILLSINQELSNFALWWPLFFGTWFTEALRRHWTLVHVGPASLKGLGKQKRSLKPPFYVCLGFSLFRIITCSVLTCPFFFPLSKAKKTYNAQFSLWIVQIIFFLLQKLKNDDDLEVAPHRVHDVLLRLSGDCHRQLGPEITMIFPS